LLKLHAGLTGEHFNKKPKCAKTGQKKAKPIITRKKNKNLFVVLLFLRDKNTFITRISLEFLFEI